MRMRWAVQAVLVLVGIWLVPTGPAHAAPTETGRYYVVGPPVDGQREYLYAIALRTLGNGNRYREIVDLNTGRAQPDGETFTDGLVLNPGWVLVLPPDAKGQGVRIGPLPRPRARPTPPVTRTPPAQRSAPAPTTAAPPRITAAPSSVPPSAPARPPATTEVAAPRRQEPTTPAGLDPLVIRVGAGVLSVLLAVAAIVLLRPGRSGRGLPVAGDDGPWPPERHHTPAPADAARAPLAAPATDMPATPDGLPANAPSSTDGAATSFLQDDTTASGPANEAPQPSPVEASSVATRTRPASVAESPGPSAATGRSVGGRVFQASDNERRATPAEADVARPAGTPARMEASTDVPRPPLPAGDEAPYLTADLDTDVGPARVRLVGVAAGRGAPPYAWLGPGEVAPPAVLPLVLGRSGPWRLHVDLARVPDVFTLVGPVAVCGRAAAALAGGLSAAGIGVAVVGETLGGGMAAGCRRLPGLPEPPGPGEELPEPSVVFVEGPSPAGARGLAAATGGRCVPVVVGPVPAGRWSLQLDVDDNGDGDGDGDGEAGGGD
ncbi:hypothetical protein [Micromonospora sp. NPDC005254]|uniref:hypothetical protein n=1 Tax=Micromonospora sp. NPDC005254 TaxID=3364229 RepID=UPI0036C7AD1D